MSEYEQYLQSYINNLPGPPMNPMGPNSTYMVEQGKLVMAKDGADPSVLNGGLLLAWEGLTDTSQSLHGNQLACSWLLKEQPFIRLAGRSWLDLPCEIRDKYSNRVEQGVRTWVTAPRQY